ncbi:CDK-activating kinase assembly factor MAT1-domain-containing protein [Suillus lakei]|nr:CDK-activating kinase assembly factor MAT1-domain-containing protein [Suillus lakei]
MSNHANVGGWLKGKTVWKASIAHTARSSIPRVQSTSSTLFSGGVNDVSGRTTECLPMHGRPMPCSYYHKMCESCIDRLFTLGPAPCPICQKVLRKLAFTPRLLRTLLFNKRRKDFFDLRSYNDYLEEVEDITFNLVNDVDIPKTEARTLNHRHKNAALIEHLQREEQYAQALKEQEDLERQEKEQCALELQRKQEIEREEREMAQREIIDCLEISTKSTAKVIAKSRAETMKRPFARSTTTALLHPPHVPLQDDWYAYDDPHTVRDHYDDMYSDAVRKDQEGIMRGEYRVEEAWDRALRCAVAGLDLPSLSGLNLSPGRGDNVVTSA